MKPANLVYFGSPAFSAEILTSLISSSWDGGPSEPVERGADSQIGPKGLLPGETKINIVGVVTSPDKPQGRKQVLTPSPVSQLAAKYDLPVFKPEKLDPANLRHLKLLKPDLFLVVAYGKIIPSSYLTTPASGTFNTHFSLLPKYRGALPVSEALKNGDQETGVSLMAMDDQLDHGPIISQKKVSIDINDNCETLTTKLTQAGIKLLSDYLPRLAGGSFTTIPQKESQATSTPSIKTRTRQNAFVDWQTIQAALAGPAAATTHNLIRSNNPDPSAWTKIPESASGENNLEIKIIETTLLGDKLVIKLVQLPGKSPITWSSFTSGHPQWRS